MSQRFSITYSDVAYGVVDTRLTSKRKTGEGVAGEKVGIPKKIRDGMLQQVNGGIIEPEET